MTVREKISLFPHQPGVYRYYDSDGNIIYVGKAKDLHKRVAQYFVDPSRLTVKTAVMVSKIADAQYSVVDSEADALLLENNLIKQYKPRYNILLKDSKTYPWICVTAEDYPRVMLTRRVVRDGSRYFGPYSSVKHAYALLDFFAKTYPLRTCKKKISAGSVLRNGERPCLNFHIGKCRGCCAGAISVKEYNDNIEEIVGLLKGGGRQMIEHYRNLMTEAASELRFEDAAACKDRMEALSQHYSKSVIADAGSGSFDVFGLVVEDMQAFGSFLRVREGSVISSMNLEFKLRLEEEPGTILDMFIGEMREKMGGLSPEVLLPFPADSDDPSFHIPSRGYKLSLLSLAAKNARRAQMDSLQMREHTDPEEYHRRVMEELRDALGMKVLPEHIECFDNSNIQGTNPVAACVVFKGGVPSKKDYRHFLVKTVIGANDYASMKEIVNRRYSRILAEGGEMPQLIVIDGGRGQLSFAWEALSELGLTSTSDGAAPLTVVGLAERMEEVIRINDPYPLFLDRNSQALKLLQQVRDEAHRFGITHHRNRRSKTQISSALDSIKGVGEKTRQRLLLRFGSVNRIASASEAEIAEITGPSLAKKILASLQN